MKKVIFVMGSPRLNGNTMKIVENVDGILRGKGIDTETVVLDLLEIYPCRNCGACEDTGDCAQKDDMQELWEKIESCDGLVLASPTYYSGVTAQMKTFIDRTGRAKVIWNYEKNLPGGARFSKGKRAMVIAVSGQPGEKWLKCSLLQMQWLLHDLEIPLFSVVKGHGADVEGGLFERGRKTEREIRESTNEFIGESREICL